MVLSDELGQLSHFGVPALDQQQMLLVVLDLAFPLVDRAYLRYDVNAGCQLALHDRSGGKDIVFYLKLLLVPFLLSLSRPSNYPGRNSLCQFAGVCIAVNRHVGKRIRSVRTGWQLIGRT